MANKNLVTQGELRETIDDLNSLAENLDEHVNQPLSEAHGWNIIDAGYLDSGGNYHTDFSGGTGQVSIPGAKGTGVASNGTLLPLGGTDPHWTLASSADARFGTTLIVTTFQDSTIPNGPKSQYISMVPVADKRGFFNSGGPTAAVGSYTFRNTFDLTGLNAASAVINGSWDSSNQTLNVLLNGVATGYKKSANHPQGTVSLPYTFTLNGPFLPGVNTLDFILNNEEEEFTGGAKFAIAPFLRVDLAGLASIGGALAVPGLFNTGVKADNTLDTKGNADAHWTLIFSADPGNPGPNAIIMTALDPAWAPNTSVSQWIGPRATPVSITQGDYVYRLTFDLTGLTPSSTVVKGTFVSDDIVTNVYLNGVATGINNAVLGSNSLKYTTSFLLATGFLSGLNTIDFVCNNSLEDTGIRVEISGTSSRSGDNLQSRVLRLNIGGNVFYIPCQVSGGMDGTSDVTITPFSGIVSPQSADPASDLTVGSPTASQLVTTFAALLNTISSAASQTLSSHAGSPAEGVHAGLSWQPDQIFTSGGYLAGRRTINIAINGVQYKLVGDFNLNGPHTIND